MAADERLPAMGGPVPVIMTREVTITKLMGCGEEASRAKQFKDDIERAWEATPGMSEQRGSDYQR